MNYELAKQLKDAGFPLIPTPSQESPQLATDLVIDHIRYQYPTLSELIEACRESFIKLIREDNGKWEVHGDIGYEYWTEQYETPEEAVAYLYLALAESRKANEDAQSNRKEN